MSRNVQELFDMNGHVAVVTGGGTGIGAGIARAFHESGAAVVLAARRTEHIEQVAKEIRDDGGSAIAVTTDVTDDGAVDALARAAVAEFGRLTDWVNNAGGSPMRMPLKDLPREEWDRTIALNLTAIYVGCVTAARHMDKGLDHQHHLRGRNRPGARQRALRGVQGRHQLAHLDAGRRVRA